MITDWTKTYKMFNTYCQIRMGFSRLKTLPDWKRPLDCSRNANVSYSIAWDTVGMVDIVEQK